MLIPLGTDRALKRRSLVTPALVLATVAAFAAMWALSLVAPDAHERIYTTLWIRGGESFRWWQPVTATLLHGGIVHLAGNMLFLWVFGKAVEDRYGRLGFLGLYVAGAYVAGFAHIWTSAVAIADPTTGGVVVQHVPAVGASGAIAAVTGSFLVLFPRTWIRSLYLFGMRIVPVPAWFMIGLAIAFDLFSQGLGVDRGVAHAAHLGGYVLGAGFSMLLLWLKVFPREPYDLFTVIKQAKKRRQIRSAAASEGARVRADRHLTKAQEARAEAIATARAQVSAAVSRGDVPRAAAAYRELVKEHGNDPVATTLSRNAQHAVVVQLVQEHDDETAAVALGRFVDAYPHDSEADGLRILLGRVLGRLGREAPARSVLKWMTLHAGSDEMRAMAQEELDELAASRPAGEVNQ